MRGGSGCHMCGRCSDHRDAIQLQARSPADEVLRVAAKETDGWQTALIVFGLLGVAISARFTGRSARGLSPSNRARRNG